ncbi:2-dehydropantoate 2-reductase [Rickettsiales bacterium]|nr:2-dehydropantoate 2-reductase [Rickettsiales bacterium]
MKILIYGVGGIGGFIGSYLKKTNYDIFFISRGKVNNLLKKNGLRLQTALGNFEYKKIDVLEQINSKINFDVIFLTVKLYDFDDVLCKLKNYIHKDTILLPFQNGIYAEDKIDKELNLNNFFGAVAQISVHINKDAEIIHKGKLASFFIGNMNDDPLNEKVELICSESQKIGLDLRYVKNIKEKLWDKFIFLSAYSGMTTFTKMTIGQIFEIKKFKDMFIEAMNESYLLSSFYDVNFSKNPVDLWIERISKMPYDMTSSMFLDYKNKKKLELDWLSGFVLKSSREFKIECKAHKKIVDGIKLI